MDLFRIEPGLLLWTWISFGILLFIMSKFVFPTLLSNLKEREDKISKSVDDAEMIREQLGDMDNQRSAMIKKAREEGQEILRCVHEEGNLLKKKLADKAELNASDILSQAKQDAEEEKSVAIQELKSELAEFVCDTSEKIIGKSFVAEEDRKWTMELADQL